MATHGDLGTALSLLREAAAAGSDIEARAEAVSAFVAGPPTVVVTGPDHPDLPATATSLEHTLAPPTRVTQVSLDDVTVLWPLRDVTVVATPADRALSGAELNLLEALHEQHLTAVVVVTGVRFISGRAGLAELEEFRLRPKLGPLGVKWATFDIDIDGDEAASAVSQHLLANHDRPAWPVVRSLADQVIDLSMPARRQRLYDHGTVRWLADHLSVALGRLDDACALAPKTAAEKIRTLQDGLDQALTAHLDEADAAGGEDGPAEVARAWKTLVDGVADLVEQRRRDFVLAITRAWDPFDVGAGQVGITLPHGDLLASWNTPGAEAAANKLSRVDVVGAITHRAGAATGDGRGGREPQATAAVVRKIGDGLGSLARSMAPVASARTQVVGAIELAVREPLASAIRQVADAVRIGAAADAAITREAMRTAIGRLQDELERRQASASAVERLIHAREEW